ncbi:hypothetical protein LguiA_000311 [Lonicera macranthoides]
MLENHMGKSIPCVLRGMVLPPNFSPLGKVFPKFVLTKQRKDFPFPSTKIRKLNEAL